MKMIVVLYILSISIGSNMVLVRLDRKNKIFQEIKKLQCIQNDVVAIFNNVISIGHCALNIESAQPVAFFNIEIDIISNQK